VTYLLNFVTFLGCVLLFSACAMCWRLYAKPASRAPGASTLNDTPRVRWMLQTLVVAVGVSALAAALAIVLAMVRIF
jgi:ABC-type Fe3+ transport system permease subunit